MDILNKRGYDPIDDYSDSGYRRPPRDAACVGDYLAALMGIEDGGKFLHEEIEEMLEYPNDFFDEK